MVVEMPIAICLTACRSISLVLAAAVIAHFVEVATNIASTTKFSSGTERTIVPVSVACCTSN